MTESANTSRVQELNYWELYRAMLENDKHARFSWQISYYDKYWIYTDYIVASEATIESIMLSFRWDSLDIVFIREPNGELSLSEKSFAESSNQDVQEVTWDFAKRLTELV